MVGKWDSVHILSLNSLVISLKGIIHTASQDWGPNLACEKLSSSRFQTVNIVRKAEILKTNSSKADK